jgi:hypothetical protein
MKVENLRSEKNGNKPRVVATVNWEDCERPPMEVYFETSEEFACDLTCNPHSFLVGCIMPAFHHGEKRVFVDGEICPELRNGLFTAMSIMRHWYYDPQRPLVQIEAKTFSNIPFPRTQDRTAQFFSGGIDSLATLRANRLNYPLRHPGSIKDCLLIHGWAVTPDTRSEAFAEAVHSLSGVTQEVGATLIPVRTNVRLLEDDDHFFLNQFQAGILAAVAHALSCRFTVAVIASSGPNDPAHWGTHPLLDSHYGSYDLRIRHDNTFLTRLERTKLVAEWDTALQNIKLCPVNWPDRNCGHCEKCLRTRLALLTLGVLDRTEAFPHEEITAEEIKSVVQIRENALALTYRELIVPLREIGRRDLAQILEGKIHRYYDSEPGWKGRIKRFDRRHLHGHLTEFKRMLSL